MIGTFFVCVTAICISVIIVCVVLSPIMSKNVRLENGTFPQNAPPPLIKDDVEIALSRAEICAKYFNMQLDVFIEKTYGHKATWRYEQPKVLPQTQFQNCVLVTVNGEEQAVLINTSSVQNFEKQTTPTQEDLKPDTSTLEDDTDENDSVTEWLITHASDIEDAVKKQCEAGLGFIAKFEVEKAIATEQFMQKLCDQLKNNTVYDVDYKENILNINFQILMSEEL